MVLLAAMVAVDSSGSQNFRINFMSIFAGVLVLNPSKTLPRKLIDELRAAVSRHPDDVGKLQEFTDGKLFMAKLDLGALGTVGECCMPEITAFVAGDPLLQILPGQHSLPRNASLEILARDILVHDHERLRACRGTYCSVVYEHGSQQLHLTTDKLGVRPIYCWVLEDFVVFATALRILESITIFDKSMNLQGVAEIVCYGHALADRTPYQEIFCLLAGETVRFDSTGDMQRKQYWRWDELPMAEPSQVPATKRIYQIFQEAVELRLGGEKIAAAQLSGGLDSRSIVAALRATDAEVFTVNCSPLNSQDHILGQLAAERLGTHHTFIPVTPLVDVHRGSKDDLRNWLDSLNTCRINLLAAALSGREMAATLAWDMYF